MPCITSKTLVTARKTPFRQSQSKHVTRCQASSSGWRGDGSVQLPGAVWLKQNFDPLQQFFVQGDNFIMHRVQAPLPPLDQPEAGCQIVLRPKPPTELQPLDQGRALTMLLPFHRPSNSDINGGGSEITIPLETNTSTATTSLAIITREEALGLVASAATGRPSLEEQGEEEMVFETNNNGSSRRTQKIKFTCRICGATNIKPINPHAWKEGTVFARCGNCNITHKLVDNLKLFHELSGPVFASPQPDVTIPESLQLSADATPHDRPVDSLWLLSINPEIGFDI